MPDAKLEKCFADLLVSFNLWRLTRMKN